MEQKIIGSSSTFEKITQITNLVQKIKLFQGNLQIISIMKNLLQMKTIISTQKH